MREFLEKASKAYYEGSPFLSDEEFDTLERLYGVDKVGYSASGTFAHAFPMYSLTKVYEEKEAPLPFDDSIVSTPKLDGAAVSLLYVEGELVLALTRGDGIFGRDITEKMKLLVSDIIPRAGVVQITGEVVAHKDIPNSRNYASGALNLKSVEEFKGRTGLAFIAYGVESLAPTQEITWTELMRTVHSWGILPVTEYLDLLGDIFPTDGTVYRINDLKEFKSRGYTSKHPRGAYAFKTREQGPTTTLVDVEWQVGKSGVVSPVAILKPVLVGDALVSRATLHNIEYIRALDLDIGCQVEVIRAGEIIPRIVRRVTS